MSLVKAKKVAIIGAGVSGLAAAKAFAEKGHDVHGFERGPDFGGVWEASVSYPNVHTQSDKDLYAFTDMPMPADYPRWPSGEQVQAYLTSHAEKHGVADRFTFGVDVTAVKQGKEGWTVTFKKGGKNKTEAFDFVAICVGQFSNPKKMEVPGKASFKKAGGTIIHSNQYTDANLAVDKRVVVIGGAKSATDVAVNAWKAGASEVTLLYRRDIWRVPYKVLGLINYKHLVFMRLQEHFFGGWNRTGLAAGIGKLTKPLGWANFRALEMVLKAQLGLKKFNMMPSERIEDDVSCNFPVVTPDFFTGIEIGKIKPVRSTCESYDRRTMKLANGESLECDLVVEAIGWEQDIPFLSAEAKNKLIADDGQFKLHRFAVNPDLPGIGFVGFNTSFATMLTSEMVANWLVRYADGQLENQPSAEQMNREIKAIDQWRKNERPVALSYGGLCVAPFHFRHMDELLADMGATKRKSWNVAAEYLSYPRAKNLRRYIDSAPTYKAS